MTTNCILWQKRKSPSGYGRICWNGKDRWAHRLVYEVFKGPIPIRYELDHLCRNRACVNPQHLEIVSHKINMQRGLNGLLKTVCVNGHPYTKTNTRYQISSTASNGKSRLCIICKRLRDLKAYYKIKRF